MTAAAKLDALIDAIALSIVARQGLPNRERAKAVLDAIREQGWKLTPPTNHTQETGK